MKNNCNTFKLSVLLSVFIIFQFPLLAEFIFLKDGQIVEGRIVRETGNSISLKKKDGKIQRIMSKDIMRVLYTDINMNRQYVQKRDGKSFIAYLVDEDRMDYTFRKDLNKPVEFKVPRKDILFISERNPSGLKGEIGPTSVNLEWMAPYGQIKKYNIYYKQNPKDEYILADSSKKNKIAIKGLERQKVYYFIVKAVDEDGSETNPSNEIKIKTTSYLPSRPAVKKKKDENGSYKLTWKPSKDKDGEVVAYRIYIYNEKEDKSKLLKETKDLNYQIPKDLDYDRIYVKAVDDNGDESADPNESEKFLVSLNPGYVYTLNDLEKYGQNGFGVSLLFRRRGMFFKNFELGLNLGAYIFDPGKIENESTTEINSMYVFPFAIFAAYKFTIIHDTVNNYDVFSIVPRISVGMSLTSIDYTLTENINDVEIVDESRLIRNYTVAGGLFFEYAIGPKIFFSLGGEYIYMIDETIDLGMIMASGAIGFKF